MDDEGWISFVWITVGGVWGSWANLVWNFNAWDYDRGIGSLVDWIAMEFQFKCLFTFIATCRYSNR